MEKGLSRFPAVSHLHYVFDGWLGDELLTTHPCFIMTKALAGSLRTSGVSGVQLGTVEVSTSELYRELHGNRQLPEFVRLIPLGVIKVDDQLKVTGWSGHDICLSETGDLVVAGRCLKIIQRYHLSHCEVIRLA